MPGIVLNEWIGHVADSKPCSDLNLDSAKMPFWHWLLLFNHLLLWLFVVVKLFIELQSFYPSFFLKIHGLARHVVVHVHNVLFALCIFIDLESVGAIEHFFFCAKPKPQWGCLQTLGNLRSFENLYLLLQLVGLFNVKWSFWTCIYYALCHQYLRSDRLLRHAFSLGEYLLLLFCIVQTCPSLASVWLLDRSHLLPWHLNLGLTLDAHQPLCWWSGFL